MDFLTQFLASNALEKFGSETLDMLKIALLDISRLVCERHISSEWDNMPRDALSNAGSMSLSLCHNLRAPN